MTTPASSNPTIAGNLHRRDSGGMPTMIAIPIANFVKSGKVNARDLTCSNASSTPEASTTWDLGYGGPHTTLTH
jgi:hypothetical protein